jgi:hypothetical protein
MVKDAENKSSLKFLHLSEARYGDCYNIWSSCGTEPFAVTMAAVKVKLTSPFLANFALCFCRVSVHVASFTLTAAIVTANGSVPQLDQIL